jgi:hypothetical protein
VFKNDEEKEQAKTAILELTSYYTSLSPDMEDNASDEIVDVRNYFRQLREKMYLLIPILLNPLYHPI